MTRRVPCACIPLLLVAACAAEADPRPVPLGSPLAELSAEELARFREGEALFNRVYTAEEGLGPLFNENQCSACHTDPAAGGTGEQFLMRASRFEPPDRCDVMAEHGGENVRARATPALEAHGIGRQTPPENATEHGRFMVPFLFGLGLVEAVPEQEILARADPDDSDGDGISGRAGRDAEGRFARFGRKGEFATLRDFSEGAFHLEMGLTTPSRTGEGTMGGAPFPDGVDPAPDPEIDERTVARVVDFVRFLAPPPRVAPRSAQDSAMVIRGERRFEEVGCAACHVPSMRTGRSDSPALDRKRVFLYSDLLLHDMGPELASSCGIAASPTELRTEMLMGLGRRRTFLHDGRTRSLLDAILMHGGEATGVRERFRALTRVEQEDVLVFLRTL